MTTNNLYRKGLWLEYFTVGYNVFEAIAAITFGSLGNSIALIGFGLDSIVESLSGLVLIWRLQHHEHLTAEAEEQIEQRATRFVAITFFILALYVGFESIQKLFTQEVPQPSLPGIIIALLSLSIMPLLAQQKHRTGRAIGSKALMADAKETLACAWLSVALLLGLGLNYLVGFWQADPIAGLIIVGFLLKEGWEAWEGEEEEAEEGGEDE
jgi:divalent metal cation (Fe/Co/Zn/Cd) transporter